MDDRQNRDIQRRLKALEERSVQVRVGEVTAVAPLEVDLGSSGVSVKARTITGTLAVSDMVACLKWDGDLIVLGQISSA